MLTHVVVVVVVIVTAGQKKVDMHSHSPVFSALGEDLFYQSLQPITPLPA